MSEHHHHNCGGGTLQAPNGLQGFVRLVKTAPDLQRLAELFSRLQEAIARLQVLSAGNATYLGLAREASTVYDAFTERVLTLSLEALSARPCAGRLPCFSWLCLGSAARQEQLHATDQDHAMVYEAESQASRQALLDLADMVVAGLSSIGFPPCDQELMASNPALTRSLEEWLATLHTWSSQATPDPDAVRMLSILLDARPLSGPTELGTRLIKAVRHTLRTSFTLSDALVVDALKARLPLAAFRERLLPVMEPNPSVNVKEAIVQPLVACIRVLDSLWGIGTPVTRERIAGLVQKKILSPGTAQRLAHAYDVLKTLPLQVRPAELERSQRAAVYASLVLLAELRDLLARRWAERSEEG